MNPLCVRRRVQIDVMAEFAIVREGLCELLICVRACPSSVPAWRVHVCMIRCVLNLLCLLCATCMA